MIPHSNYCYFNGTIIKFEDCNLHIADLQLQRGYGVFDFFRIRNGHIPWLDDYTDRLFNSIRLSGMDNPLSREQFHSVIDELQQKNGSHDSAIKVLVTGGYSENLEQVTGKPNMAILHLPWSRPPGESFDKGVSLISDRYLRPNPEIKTLNYFNSLRLHRKMKEYGAVDVLYHLELVTECSRASVFFVKGGEVFTTRSNILDGITRKQVLSMFGEIRLKDLPFEHLSGVDEMFITSTSRDITPVTSVDGKHISDGTPGKTTREIQSAFRKRGW